MAGGAAQPGPARSRHPGLSRGREPLHRGVSQAAAGAAEDAGRRDARPHQGRRFRACPNAGRAVRLSLEIPRRRPARIDRPHAARRRRGPGPARRRRAWPRACRTSISAARAIRPTIASKPGAPTCAARSSSPSACATGRPAPICPTSSSRPAAAWSGAAIRRFFYYVRLDDNHRPLHIYRHRLGTPQSADALVYAEPDNGWFVVVEESASRPLLHRRHRQPGDLRALADRPQPRRRRAAPGGGARDRRALQRRTTARTSSSS